MAAPSTTIVDVPPCGCGEPGKTSPSNCYCSVENLLRVIRRRYSLALLNAIHQSEPARYRHLANRLPQASSSTLAETLGALEAAHLVVHHRSDGDPTSTYSLTESGVKLLSRLKPLLDDIQR